MITRTINTNEDLTDQIIGLKCPECVKEARLLLQNGELDQEEYEDMIEESDLIFIGGKLECNHAETYHQLRIKISLEVIGDN